MGLELICTENIQFPEGKKDERKNRTWQELLICFWKREKCNSEGHSTNIHIKA